MTRTPKSDPHHHQKKEMNHLYLCKCKDCQCKKNLLMKFSKSAWFFFFAGYGLICKRIPPYNFSYIWVVVSLCLSLHTSIVTFAVCYRVAYTRSHQSRIIYPIHSGPRHVRIITLIFIFINITIAKEIIIRCMSNI